MRPTSDGSKLERESVQWLVREAVKAGMESPLRDSILEAVDETTDEEETAPEGEHGDDDEDPGEKGRLTKAVQGLVVFVVMFVLLYTALRRLTDDED